MKKLFFLALLVFSLSCNDDEGKGNLKVNVQLTYGSEPLKMFEEYTYPTGESFFFSRFSFFTSKINLTDENGKANEILDIAYHDLTNSHSGNQYGYSFTIGDVPTGSYNKLSFGLGVAPEFNAKTPADYDSDNILSNQSEYWGGWQSYIFTRTEGKIDLDGDGTKETGFALHTGADAAYRTISFDKSMAIEDGKTQEITLVVDLKKSLGVDNIYDIKSNPQIHSLSQQPFVIELIDNLKTSFAIK